MDDLISRAAAIKTILDLCPETTIQGSYDEYAVSCLCGASELLKQLPAVDAAPVVYGHWIEDRTDIVCSVCGARYKDEIVFMPDFYENGKRYDGLKYCPSCGAKMDGEANG